MISYSKAEMSDCQRLDFLFSKLLKDDKTNYDSNIKDGLTMNGFFSKRINLEDTILFVARCDNEIIGYIYGYVRSETELMWFTIILLVIIVQVFQECGMLLAKKFDHRINK